MMREDYGTHSLRRTKSALIYKQTGNLRAVQILLGHTKIESMARYQCPFWIADPRATDGIRGWEADMR